MRYLATEAAQTVPHYRELFRHAGLAPMSITSAENLSKVPITPRSLLASVSHRRFLRDDVRLGSLYASHTSGSTGTPATIFLSRLELNYRRWLLIRAIHHRFPRLFPRQIADVGQMTSQKADHLIERFGPFTLMRIPGNLPMGRQVDLYRRSSPQLLEGYAGCLELLAEALRSAGSYPRPLAVISRGEILLPAGRKAVEEAFACPVADFYNSEEIGNIAWECRTHPGVFHVNTDAVILELVDAKGVPVPSGVEGRAIMTNLYNRTMPFLRYDSGDYATWLDSEAAHCTCGANTPTLASIDGRTDDFIHLPDGRRVSPLIVLTAVLNGTARKTAEGAHVGQARQFQVVQESQEHLLVRLVPGTTPARNLEAPLRDELRKLHSDLIIDIECVDAISREPSGKLRRIVCNLPT